MCPAEAPRGLQNKKISRPFAQGQASRDIWIGLGIHPYHVVSSVGIVRLIVLDIVRASLLKNAQQHMFWGVVFDALEEQTWTHLGCIGK